MESHLSGSFRHKVDAKGRLFVPARWREAFAEGAHVTEGIELCVYILTKVQYDIRADQFAELNPNKKAHRDTARKFFGPSHAEVVDANGRLTIPAILREYADIKKEVFLVGVGNRAEIWDRARWIEYKGRIDESSEATSESVEI